MLLSRTPSRWVAHKVAADSLGYGKASAKEESMTWWTRPRRRIGKLNKTLRHARKEQRDEKRGEISESDMKVRIELTANR